MRYVIEYRREGENRWQVSGNHLHGTGPGTNLPGVRLSEYEFPSLEAAQAEAREHQRASMSNLTYRARDTQPELSEGPLRDYFNEWTMRGELMTDVAQGRTVRIYRRNSQWVIDSGGRELPMMAALLPYLPQSARVSARVQYQVQDALRSGINPQMLAGAIAAYFTEHPNADGQLRIEEAQADLPDNMAYLAFGDFVYRMVPVRQVNNGRAMKAMREKLAQEIRTLRTGLEQQAGIEARAIVARAEEQAAVVRERAARVEREISTQVRFPEWTRGWPVKTNGETVWLAKETRLVMDRAIHGSRVWPISPNINVHVDLWLPLNGQAERIHLVTGRYGSLPHVSTGSACVKIGEKVKDIKDLATLEAFQWQVQRAFTAINLASLLESDWRTWLKEIQEGMPAVLQPWLNSSAGDRHAQMATTGLPPAPNQERPEETWTAQAR